MQLRFRKAIDGSPATRAWPYWHLGHVFAVRSGARKAALAVSLMDNSLTIDEPAASPGSQACADRLSSLFVDRLHPIAARRSAPDSATRTATATPTVADGALLRALQVLNPGVHIQMARPPRTRIVSICNQKGGVGKTATAVNVAVTLALHGNRVLVIDLDSGGYASAALGVPHHAGIPDVYDCLVASTPLSEVVQEVPGIPGLWCVPATIDLAGADLELHSMVARESRLLRALQSARADDDFALPFDYVFVDCPPSIGLLTVNALVASTEVLIPIPCEYHSLEGVQVLINNINLVKAHVNLELEVGGLLLTMYDHRNRVADAVEKDVRAYFGHRVLAAVVPRDVSVSEANAYGQSVIAYDPQSAGAASYFQAAREIATQTTHFGSP
jgi:chromosome partitioning protein